GRFGGSRAQHAAPPSPRPDGGEDVGEPGVVAGDVDEVVDQTADDRGLGSMERGGQSPVRERDAAERIADRDAVARAAERRPERIHLLAVSIPLADQLAALDRAGDHVREVVQVAAVGALDDVVPGPAAYRIDG